MLVSHLQKATTVPVTIPVCPYNSFIVKGTWELHLVPLALRSVPVTIGNPDERQASDLSLLLNKGSQFTTIPRP